MKTLRMACMAGVFCVMTGAAMVAQKADVTVIVTGICADGGQVMTSAGDMQDREHMVYAMTDPAGKSEVQLVLKDVPVGMCDIYVFQDLNGNKKLDRNADGVPTEPCYMKQKVKVADHGVLLKAHLVNPSEMMGK